MRNRDRRVELVKSLLKVPVANGVDERPIEVSVESSDHGAVGFLDSHDRKNRAERGVDVDDVVLPEAEYPPQIFSQLESPGKPSLRSIGVDRLASTDAYDVQLVARPRN